MSFSTQLHLRQQQRLVMTPMLRQALKILQMNSIELADLARQELAENPVLEEVEGDATGLEEGDVEPPSAEEAAEAAAEASGEPAEGVEEPRDEREAPDLVKAVESNSAADDSWQDYFDDNGTDYRGSGEKSDDDKDSFEQLAAASVSLQEHLLGQLEALGLSARERYAAEELIGRLDDRGYLLQPLDELARETGLSDQEAFAALRRAQRLEPAGVAARDLRECLLLQLEARGLKGSLAWLLVSEHLAALESRDHQALALKLKLPLAELDQAAALIASLEPNPGRPYGVKPNPSVAVEGQISRGADGSWQITLNERDFPRLGVSNYYRRLLKSGEAEREDAKQWLQDKFQSAVWLIRGIEQRQKTLRRVLGELAEAQSDYLEHGPASLKPLTLKDIAEKTGLHESTVSRVTSGKYVQTPRGVLELRSFFNAGLATEGGGEASTASVRERLKELIEEENASAPLSDQALAEQLSREGVRIARRTVAKYREELGLAPAHKRGAKARV